MPCPGLNRWISKPGQLLLKKGLVSIKTREIAFDNLHHMPVWKYHEMHSEDDVNFIKPMSGLTQGAIMNILPVYDFFSFATTVDIGVSNGALLNDIPSQVMNANFLLR